MSFWSPRGRIYLTLLCSLLLVALCAEWHSVRSSSTGAISKLRSSKLLGLNDSRQLQMQKAAANKLTPSSEPLSDSGDSTSSGSSSSSSSPASSEVSFLQAHPELGSEPGVQDFQQTVHGRMEKKGHLQWEHWSTRKAEARFDSFLSWRINRTVNGPPAHTAESYTCAAADHPKLPFPGCHVFINHNYKYIYIRSPKAASTSIVDELGECNNIRTRGYNSSTCMGMHSSWEFFYKDTKNITDMWRDYFVFGFVRNPWKRAYSLYKYMQSDGCMPGDNPVKPQCQVDWGEFCRDPWGSSDRVHDSGCLSRSKSYMYFHMMDQHHCMVTETGDWAVDFVGRVENANEDWAEVSDNWRWERVA
eukprot:GHUV01016980.1.p1 GENE.GHUV01016980.1~~GHUV01016980.1.p1  ORF type:complete len:360 (+),score=69.06 GHUV01016980.1:529-1608(+)